jgi:hypothetical protein
VSAAAEATADTREPAELELPQVNPAALHAALVDLDHFIRWSARARYGNVLQGWAGQSAGATVDASRDQVRGLLFRLGMPSIGAQDAEGVAWDGMLALTLALAGTDDAELRERMFELMSQGPRDPADGRDPDWTRGVAVERRLIALASSRSPAHRRAAAVLCTMAKRCPPDTLADDVARVVATVHATPDARRAWERAELAAVGKTGKAGRPQVNRNVPPLRLIAGTALVAEALAVWSQQKDNEHG